ncbi:uncharacterized protein PV07_04171 [Cladophialophora immunda]|uniref:Uncharacterized protein n=1 Tax=Cladophialophora immunda TaxID=569365 RepID=A0A0D1ZWV8_9EURO|nr:uncharacterized protein PV07_04171 [Cladophialophora immunda]KIW32641.1 hypothetical protein PV07_04171 [Cladophialophora immunda]
MFHLTTGRDILFNSRSMEPPTTPDTMTQLLEDPFGTWLSTFLFIVLLVALGSCAIFLGSRYAEILGFDAHHNDDLPLISEGPRQIRSGDDGEDAGYLFDETPISQITHSQDDHQFDIRRRPGTADVQPNCVTIGEVREGRIAQRRASSSRGTGRKTHVPGHLVLKPLSAYEYRSMV